MKLNQVLKEAFNAKENQLSDDIKLTSYEEWDSMSHMLFITKIEETYGIELSGDEIANMQTVGDIKKVLSSKGKQD
jgi:acyl carrier protein